MWHLRQKWVLLVGLCLIFPWAVFGEEHTVTDGADRERASQLDALRQKKWIHGSADCDSNADPKIDVLRYDRTSFILRQNKCDTFEAPFVYVLVGETKVLVLDTGATEIAGESPLYEKVMALMREHGKNGQEFGKDILVAHSHSHTDHSAGDSQFEGKPGVVVVEPAYSAVIDFFGFADWPAQQASLELGGRRLIIIPTPGHQEEAIAIYDPQTQWLLTGDTLYPGQIFVKNWTEFSRSIERLSVFVEAHPVSALLGTHIEMSNKSGELYPIGATYQPNESPLPLGVDDLKALQVALDASNEAREIVLTAFVVSPMGVLQKTISNIFRWLSR